MKTTLLHCTAFLILGAMLASCSVFTSRATQELAYPIVIEATDRTHEGVILKLSPKSNAKIPLKPGITLSSNVDIATNWNPSLPHTYKFKGEYLKSETVTLDFGDIEEDGTIDLQISIAYCPTEEICKFLDLELSIPPASN